ncbi:MAG: hypothetical protein MI674_07720 [Cytophagales bacterium]|nr:hypothetical protein [Cytophagales bacterium]
MSKKKITRLDYSEFLLSSQTNYTLTYFAEHKQGISHDKAKRYLENVKLTPALLWEHTAKEIIESPNAHLLFDDTVLDKNYSKKVETAKFQYSGNAKGVIRGIGIVTCVYYNPDCHKFWVIDYRIYDKDADGKSKLDHLKDMLKSAIFSKKISFSTVLMEAWYATVNVMYTIHAYGKIFYCPIKSNRLVSYIDANYHHIPVKDLAWCQEDLQCGQRVHLWKTHKDFRVQLFRLPATHRTDFIVTNDLSQNSSDAVRNEYVIGWKVEELHRELKQSTGMQCCHCRKQRIQRNHIACAFLVWRSLKNQAYKMKTTIYAIKRKLLANYMRQQLCSPAIPMTGFA